MINSVWRGSRFPLTCFGRVLAAYILATLPSLSYAQPSDLPVPAVTTTTYPPGVVIIETNAGRAYGNKKRQTLYGLDMRTVLRAGPDPAQFCARQCSKDWVPMVATKGTVPNIVFPPNGSPKWQPPEGFVSPQNAPDWTVIKGPKGPQWVYKGWHLVFTRKGEKRGGAGFDGVEGKTWNILRFVPPIPQIIAPGNVRPVFADGAYTLMNSEGRILFTGNCTSNCLSWRPFTAGMASTGIGDWKVMQDGDVPQWTYKGALVFLSDMGAGVPQGGKALQP